jgi:predicted DNA-binding antitoxin AbrB/MazE fold protein
MPLTVQAIDENGVLKPDQPLPLQEHKRVEITLHPRRGTLHEAYGIMGFTGSAAEADYFAMDAELDFAPPPAEP